MPDTNLVKRDLDAYKMADLTSELLHPERVALRADSVRKIPIDIGSICYTKRNGLSNGIQLVDLNSIRGDRKELVRCLVDYFVLKAYRDSSLASKWRDITNFLKWTDDNGFCDFLESPDKARNCYIGYVDYLNYRISSKGDIEPTSARALQQTTIVLLRCFFTDDVNYIIRKVPTIKAHKKSKAAPKKKAVKQYIDVLKVLSMGLSKQLMEGKTFPLYLEFEGFSTYLFHGQGRNIRTPYSSNPFLVYNFDEGRIATPEEHFGLSSSKSRSNSLKAVSDSQATLDEVKSNPRHPAVLSLITLAMNSYAALLQAVTGANPSLVPDLDYSEAIELINSPVKKELTSVKFRANGKVVRLPIGGKKGVGILKNYIKFRDWVLDGKEFDKLFFDFIRQGNFIEEPRKMHASFQSRLFRKRLRGKYLPSDFKNVTPTLVRKYKSVILHELKVVPDVVAATLGHSVKTNTRSYSEVSEDKQKEEFGKFWRSVKASAKQVAIASKSDAVTPTVVGACDDIGNPEIISSDAPIKPNCKTQYGCLYCKHYCCHADEEDIHKLLSLVYVMTEVRQQAENIEHADDLLRELCVRARYIVEAVAALSDSHKTMIENQEKQVFDLGVLTPFWEARLTRYEDMGVVL